MFDAQAFIERDSHTKVGRIPPFSVQLKFPMVLMRYRRAAASTAAQRDVAQAGSAPALGAGGREFKSLRPDQRGGCRPFPRRSRSHRDERNDRLPSAPLAGVAQWLEPLPSKQDMRVRFSSPAPPQDSGVFSPPASPRRPPALSLSSRSCRGSRQRPSPRGRPSGPPTRRRSSAKTESRGLIGDPIARRAHHRLRLVDVLAYRDQVDAAANEALDAMAAGKFGRGCVTAR